MKTSPPPAVPVVSLKEQIAAIRSDIEAAIRRVLESGAFVLGAEVKAFERDFAAFCGVRHAVGVNSGTSALHLALLAAGVGPGDEVITVPFTFLATVAAIEYAGARPVLVDVEADSFTMDPAQIESRITPKTKAIIPVHLYGQAAEMDAINAIARRHGLVVVEDASQAHGAGYRGRRAGALGDIGCFSFYPTKNLGAYGEAGGITTDNDRYAERLRLLRDWGQEAKYRHVLRGLNCRMEELQGAVLSTKLRFLPQWTEARRRLATRYGELLASVADILPAEMPGREHVYHIYAVRLRDRQRIRQRLTEQGIGTAIHYPEPVHLIGPYRNLGYAEGSLPISEALARETLSLPLYPELSDQHQQRVGAALLSCLQ
jgi:dTDP-4-amino-4,6-dideoxygalactose transaminase